MELPNPETTILNSTATFTKAANPKTPPPARNWYNNMFPLLWFKSALYYALPDNRKQIYYSRLKTEQYIEYGTQAEDARRAWYKSYADANKPVPKKIPSFAVNGVNGVLELIRALRRSFGFEKIGYDMMHFAMNANSYFLELVKGKRGLTDKQRKCSIAQNIFPFMKYAKLYTPWEIPESDVIIADSIVNSFLLPSGFSSLYSMKFPLRRTGNLRAKEHSIFMTTYAHYVYSFTRMESPYRLFFARFASDLNRLSSPCIRGSELTSVTESIYETRALQEGLFPDSEKQFIFHEIVDMAHHVFKLGHISGVQCYAGERSLATIGRLRAKGGIHYVKGLFYNYIALENTHQYDTGIKPEFLDNSPTPKYSDFVVKLHGKSHLLPLNDYEMNSLLDSVVELIESDVSDNRIQLSNFYRLRKVYAVTKSRLGTDTLKTYDFYTWVKELHKRYNCEEIVVDDLLWQEQISFEELSDEDLELFTDAGGLMYRDFEGIIKDVATFTPRIFKKAIIKGLSFTARGKQYREGMQSYQGARKNALGRDVMYYAHTNNLNSLQNHWWNSEDYSSWCRIHYKSPSDRYGAKPRVEMAQSNYFLRLNFPSDMTVHGLAFADMCIRNTSYDAERRHHFVTPVNCFNGERQFVCLNNVCSTKLALSVLDENNLPIIRKSKFASARWTVDTSIIKVAAKGAEVSKIYFIEMHPERVEYMYQSFVRDLDGTRNWEKNIL